MIVDVVDQKNRTVATAPRQVLFRRRLNFRTVDILLFDRQERLVMQLLPADHLRNPNRLGASVAGYLYTGESYFEAARRKMRSELQIGARIRGIGTFEMIDEGCHKFVHVYVGQLRQQPRFDPDEIADLIPLTRLELEQRLERFPNDFTPTFLFVYEQFRRWRSSK